MTLYQFVLLKRDEQANAVWDGVFLGERFYKGIHIQLYSVGDFYVELSYDAKKNKILRMRPFSSRRLLDPYLKKVSLTEINRLL